jgi:signal transduction histidine kinase
VQPDTPHPADDPGLLSTLAHEMRTSLTAIKGCSTALLADEIALSPEARREFLQIIDQECDVLQELVHNLLESSRIDAGRLRLELQPVRLQRLVEGAIRETGQTPRHHYVVELGDVPIVDADPARIEQVLRNLLDNAVKYSPQGGMIVIRGERRQAEGQGEVVVSVADQGMGIAPEHLNRLFEKFFRVESEVGHRVSGTGLGLPIAQAIIEGHGGHIWAESKLGQGSTFYFTLPLGRSASAGCSVSAGCPTSCVGAESAPEP